MLFGIDLKASEMSFWHGYDWFFASEIHREDFVGTENGVLPKDIILVCEHPPEYEPIAMLSKGSTLDSPGFDAKVIGGFTVGFIAVMAVAGLRHKCKQH